MAYSESFLQELSERNDIADVVSGYVSLSKRSGSNLFGLCPFHSEKTPSFSVNRERQIYHCFGCGKSGSVISFIMEIENLSFPEAVEFLARRAGMEVPEDKPDELGLRRRRMLELNREAARFFYGQLVSPSGKIAQDYVNQRGISAAMVKNFGLGFAPDSWSSLTDAMSAKGFSWNELADAGLVRRSQKGKGVYDTFRSRLMFPVIDVRGNVIGFSGRILGDGEPKYMNSPETLVFNKSRNLFALNLAKKSKSGYIILAEGNVDVVSLHQAGFDSAVASLGTSLTEEQARLISRYTNQVVIAYDNDGAGQKASQRAIGILEKLDIRVRVLRLQGAKDPDEFIKLKGADAFRSILERSENHVEYRLQSISDKYDMKNDEQRVAFLREAAEFIASLPNSVEREVYGMRAAESAGVSPDAFASEVGRLRKRLAAQARRRQERDELRPAKAIQPKEKSLRYDNIRSAAAEEGVIALLYHDPDLFSVSSRPDPEDFSSPALGHIYRELLTKSDLSETVSIASLGGILSGEEISLLTGIIQKPAIPSANRENALRDYIEIIKREKSRSAAVCDPRARADELRKTKGYGG